MTRTLFPYDEDKHVIHEFLHGRDASSDYLESKTSNGTHVLIWGFITIAFIDAQGALQVNVPGATGYAPTERRVLNHLLDLVQHEHRLDRATGEHGMDPVTTFDGVELTGGVPMTLLGPLGVRAWREANR